MEAARALPAGTLLDGEIVIADEAGHADFGALQQRLTVARRNAGQAAQQQPAALLAFDVLELSGKPIVDLPLLARRKRLEEFLPGLHPCLQLWRASGGEWTKPGRGLPVSWRHAP